MAHRCWENKESKWKRAKLTLRLTQCTELSSKWIESPREGTEHIELKENMEEQLVNMGPSSNSLVFTSQNASNKSNGKLKVFCTAKGTLTKMNGSLQARSKCVLRS